MKLRIEWQVKDASEALGLILGIRNKIVTPIHSFELDDEGWKK